MCPARTGGFASTTTIHNVESVLQMKYGSASFIPFTCSNRLMLKQMRQWQNAFTITLVLMCVGVGLSHNIEAALNSDHGEHCSICISGNSSPVISNALTSLDNLIINTGFALAAPRLAYKNALWPDYTTRAPPLV